MQKSISFQMTPSDKDLRQENLLREQENSQADNYTLRSRLGKMARNQLPDLINNRVDCTPEIK